MKRKFGFGDIISSKSEKTAPEDEYLTKINHNPEAIKKAEILLNAAFCFAVAIFVLISYYLT